LFPAFETCHRFYSWSSVSNFYPHPTPSFSRAAGLNPFPFDSSSGKHTVLLKQGWEEGRRFDRYQDLFRATEASFHWTCLVTQVPPVWEPNLYSGSGVRSLFRPCRLDVLYTSVPWLRLLVADLSLRRPGFAAGSVLVGFAVNKVAVEHVSNRVVLFSPVSIIPPLLSILIHQLEDE
jgi:hypothetical protein